MPVSVNGDFGEGGDALLSTPVGVSSPFWGGEGSFPPAAEFCLADTGLAEAWLLFLPPQTVCKGLPIPH